MTQQFRLNPLSVALAAACTVVVAALVIGLPMAGMMGGYGRMMGGGGSFGFGILGWLAGALFAALLGALFAWVYNAVSARAGG